MRIRDYLPQTLMGRSILIMVVPVILAQIIAITVFWDNHWDKVTRRLADSVAGEIAIVSDQIQNNYSKDVLNILTKYMREHLRMEIVFEVEEQSPEKVETQIDYGFSGNLLLTPLITTLEGKLNAPYNVILNRKTEEVTVQIQLTNGFLSITIPEQRLFSSSGYVFIILLVFSAFSLLAISLIFLRNQIRPIRRLAAAASLMGKGRNVALGSPRGAREVRQAWEAFETMQRRIRRQIEQRTAMLAGVSHDLRTPLTRVKLGLSMIDDQKEASDMMADLDEMEKMMNAYLEFARGEKIEDVTETDLEAFIEDILEAHRTDNFKIDFDVKSNNSLVPIQKVNLRRCLENIIGNAAHYADHVLITLDMTGTRVYISIEDNGCGIREDQYDEVFKPFVRLDPSRSKNTGGAGLGLSIAMDIIMAHGGKISLSKSDALGGLKVDIRIPI